MSKDSIETICDFIRAEAHEIDAFIECILMREKYE